MRLTNEMHCGTLVFMSVSVPDASLDLTSLLVLARMARQRRQPQNHSKYVVVVLHKSYK